jgi:hypothetical protein
LSLVSRGTPGVFQWLRFIFDPFVHLTALEEAEVIRGKDSDTDTRIKPLALTNGHGRYSRCAGQVTGNNRGLETGAYIQKISLINDARVKKIYYFNVPDGGIELKNVHTTCTKIRPIATGLVFMGTKEKILNHIPVS